MKDFPVILLQLSVVIVFTVYVFVKEDQERRLRRALIYERAFNKASVESLKEIQQLIDSKFIIVIGE